MSVNHWARQMQQGPFLGEVHFVFDGHLVSGQHRLHASAGVRSPFGWHVARTGARRRRIVRIAMLKYRARRRRNR